MVCDLWKIEKFAMLGLMNVPGSDPFSLLPCQPAASLRYYLYLWNRWATNICEQVLYTLTYSFAH